MKITTPQVKCNICRTNLVFAGNNNHNNAHGTVYAYCPKCTNDIIEVKLNEQIGI